MFRNHLRRSSLQNPHQLIPRAKLARFKPYMHIDLGMVKQERASCELICASVGGKEQSRANLRAAVCQTQDKMSHGIAPDFICILAYNT